MTAPPLRPGGVPLLGHYPEFRRDPLAFWRDTGRLGPVVRVRLGPLPASEYWVVTDPGLLDHILRRRPRAYPRERRLLRLTRGTGPELLFSTPRWEEWRRRRRLLRPALHGAAIERAGAVIVGEAARLASTWCDGDRLDLVPALKGLTMRIIARAMFGVDGVAVADPGPGDTDLPRLQRTFEVTSAWTYRQVAAPVAVPLWLPAPGHLRAWAARREQLALLRRIAAARLARPRGEGDLLDLLVAAHLEGRLSLAELVGEMGGIAFAGHETTAMTLTWLLYEVSRDGGLEAGLLAELDGALAGRDPTLDDLARLPRLERAVLEALRKYPPVYLSLREAGCDDDVDGLHIPRGTKLALNVRGLHHHPDHWPDPERFDPERFADPGWPRAAFLPFLEGARKCLGDAFAMAQLRLVAAVLIRRRRLRYAGAEPPRERPGFVMEPSGPVWMAVGSGRR